MIGIARIELPYVHSGIGDDFSHYRFFSATVDLRSEIELAVSGEASPFLKPAFPNLSRSDGAEDCA